jgi:hypothetical protein
MYLIYFDEVKPDGDKQADYWLGAIAVDESQLARLEDRVACLSSEIFGSKVLSSETEFHAAEIYHRKNAFKDWPDFDKRLDVISKLLEILSDEEVHKIYIRIRAEKLYSGVEPDKLAFMFLCERCDAFMKAKKATGLMIGDRDGDSVAARYAQLLSKYRIERTEYEYGGELKHLVDTVHFTQSHLSRLLQLADIHVWCRQFRCANRSTDDERKLKLLRIFDKYPDAFNPRKYKEFPAT